MKKNKKFFIEKYFVEYELMIRWFTKISLLHRCDRLMFFKKRPERKQLIQYCLNFPMFNFRFYVIISDYPYLEKLFSFKKKIIFSFIEITNDRLQVSARYIIVEASSFIFSHCLEIFKQRIFVFY